MSNQITIKRTIPNILHSLYNANDIKTISYLENIMISMYASALLLLAAIISFAVRYFILLQDGRTCLFYSSIFLFLGISFEVATRISLNGNLVTLIISGLASLTFAFIAIGFFDIIGHNLWIVGFIQLMLAIMRVTKTMFNFLVFTIIISNAYVFYHASDVMYFQIFLFLILFIISYGVHNVNIGRYNRIGKQLKEVLENKEEITALYKELTASQDELLAQNNQLIIYNTEIKQNEEKLNYLAYHDILTKLPNRKMLIDQIDFLIQLSKQQFKPFYVVFIDLDNFKKVNDTFGHHNGDLLLKAVGNRMKDSIFDEDLLGRMGGDEFTLILRSKLRQEDVLQYVESISESFLQPFIIDNTKIIISASFGISAFPRDGDDTMELLKSADISMYKAKELGKNNIQLFSKGMQEEVLQKIGMETRLKTALKKQEFFLVMQPQYSVRDNKIRGFEALVRWQCPDLGAVSPMEFIPFAEEMGLIIPLGKWILKTACYKYKLIQEKYHLNACICVNISPVQMKDPKFIEFIKNVLEETGIKPEFLEIEITESVFIASIHETIELLNELKAIGIRIALDDFGSGYSSLRYLKILPIDTLKLDKYFVDDLLWQLPEKHIVGNIIDLAHDLGISIIAEGVEHENQLNYLKNHGCDYIQGFLLSRPLTEDALKTLLDFSVDRFEYL